MHMHMLEKIVNINCFFFLEKGKKTNQLNEIVLMKQIEYVVQKVNVQKDITLFVDPIVKTLHQNYAK